MSMRVVTLLPRVLVHSARTTLLLHQLPRTNYGMAPQLCRGFYLTHVLPSSTAKDNEHKTIDEMVAERIEDIKSGKFQKMKDPQKLKHFRTPPSLDADHSLDPTMVPKDGATTGGKYTLPHPIWSEREVYSVKDTHKTPKGISDWLAYLTVKSLRTGYDIISGYHRRTRDESLWIKWHPNQRTWLSFCELLVSFQVIMSMRVVTLLPRVLVHSARTTLLLHQLPRTNYGMAPQLCRGFYLTHVLPSSTAKDNEHKTIDEMVAERIEDIKSGKFQKMKDPQKLKHFRTPPSLDADHSLDPTMVPKDGATTGGKYTLPHPIWSEREVYSVKDTHKTPKGISDWLAYLTVKSLRTGYDIISGYHRRTRDESLWINRIIFMEAISAVPGMVAAMVRHIHSVRRMRRDHGWIHTLLEEAENERMHLMTALQLKQPSLFFKAILLSSQGLFILWFGIAYLIAPRYCHRFVGYMEEEAVQTFTKCLKDIDDGPLSQWKTRSAPEIAINYWHLPQTATMKDVILAMRADEAHHRIINHTLASMNKDDFNPYKPGE